MSGGLWFKGFALCSKGHHGSRNAQKTYLYFGFDDEVSVTRVRHTKYASKLIHGETANVPNFLLKRLMVGGWVNEYCGEDCSNYGRQRL